VMFGSPETTPGGRALKFYASVRLDIRRIETLKDGAEAYGNRVRVKVVKNKVAPPFRQAEFDVIYGQGISWEGTVLDVGLEKAIVQKSGSFFSFEEERIGQGREKAKAFLREHPDVLQRMLNRIQAVSEGALIPGATVPPPGLALGEVPAESPAPEPEEASSNGVHITASVGDA
jgi:recombination protein RecA